MINHYEATLKQVLNNIKNKRYQTALQTLDKELGMPYTPLAYEQKFLRLRTLCWQKTKQSQKSVPTLKTPKIFQVLATTTDPLLNVALNQLSKLNLRALLTQVSDILSNKRILNVVKVSVWAMLVVQQVNHTFLVQTNFVQRSINPCQDNVAPLPGVNARVTAKIEALTHQDPSLQRVAFDFLHLYWINLFPGVSNEQGLAEALVYVAQKSLVQDHGEFFKVNNEKLAEVKSVLRRSGWGQPIYNR